MLMIMHNALHPTSDAHRVYIPRKVCGRGSKDVNKSVNLTNFGLENIVKEIRECLLPDVRSVDIDLIEPV